MPTTTSTSPTTHSPWSHRRHLHLEHPNPPLVPYYMALYVATAIRTPVAPHAPHSVLDRYPRWSRGNPRTNSRRDAGVC